MVGTIWSMAPPTVSSVTGLAVSGGSPASKVYDIALAATHTSTLPPALGTGDLYIFFTSITATGDHIIQVTTTDIIQGGVSISTDIAGVTMLTASTTDTITMSGSTTGGVKGSWVSLRDVATGIWMLDGFLASTGTEATPFSAAVS